MNRLLRRVSGGLLLLGMLTAVGGSDCTPAPSGITLHSLQAQVDTLSAELCQIYADRGATPPAGPNGSFDCP